jgi:hypothetical protein
MKRTTSEKLTENLSYQQKKALMAYLSSDLGLFIVDEYNNPIDFMEDQDGYFYENDILLGSKDI